MTTANASYPRIFSNGPAWALRGARNGLVAGVVMAMVMMMLGLFDKGFFAAPSSIWAFWAGPSVYAPTTVSLSFVIGAMGHMMNSAIFGLIFAGLFSRAARSRLGLIIAGAIYGLVIFGIMWYGVVPAIDPVMLKLNATVFAFAHFMWGVALGLLAPQAAGLGVRLQGA